MSARLSPWAACALWLLAGWVAIFAAALATWSTLEALPADSPVRPLFNFLPNLLGISLVLLIGLRKSPVPVSRVLALRRPRWSLLPAVALSTLGLALLAAELDTWIQEVYPAPEWVMEIYRQVLEFHDTRGFLGVFAFLIVVAPVTEELLFRGLFLSRLRERYGGGISVAGSALCFGVFHILPWQVVTAAIMGLYLGWLVLRSRSIFVPIFSHAVFNLVPVVASRLESQQPPLLQVSGSEGAAAVHLPWPWIAGGFLVLGLGLAAIRRLAPLEKGAAEF